MFLRFLILLLLGYLLYKLIKPSVLNKPAHSHVKGDTITKNTTPGPKEENIEDADFEDIEE